MKVDTSATCDGRYVSSGDGHAPSTTFGRRGSPTALEQYLLGAGEASLYEEVRPRGARVATQQLAPQPSIDRYPIQYGSAITLSYLSSCMRLSLTGLRMQMVDLLDELLDLEPHGFSVVSKRILAVANGRIELTPGEVEDSEKERAQEIRDFCWRQLDAIPYLTEHFASLLWAIFYGPVGAELLWKQDRQEWHVTELGHIHSRRLSYPDYARWDLYVWDQGMVRDLWPAPTNGVRGLRIADFPNKFLVYAPRLRGNYPTREGLGRILSTFWCLKRLVLRVTAQDFERFVKPWVIAYYNTGNDENGQPRAAEDEDIEDAKAAASALGVGSLSSVTLPNSIKMELVRAAQNLDALGFLKYLDDASTKASVGQTFTTEPGASGAKAASETASNDTNTINRFDSRTFSDMLRQELLGAMVRVNYPDLPARFIPKCKIHIDGEPRETIGFYSAAAAAGIPADGRRVADNLGIELPPSLKEPGPDGKLKELWMRPIKSSPEEVPDDLANGNVEEPPKPGLAPPANATDDDAVEPKPAPPAEGDEDTDP